MDALISFLEKVLLLLLAAVITGILVPLIKARMDRTAFEGRKRFEASLAQQADIIKAQTQFLTRFADYIWEYHKISQRVSYRRLSGDAQAYEKAVKEYQEAMWNSLHKIRGAIGGARWFTSDVAHDVLTSWYDEWFLVLELKLRQLISADPKVEDWHKHHVWVHDEAGKRNYELLHMLAREFGLRAIVDGA